MLATPAGCIHPQTRAWGPTMSTYPSPQARIGLDATATARWTLDRELWGWWLSDLRPADLSDPCQTPTDTREYACGDT